MSTPTDSAQSSDAPITPTTPDDLVEDIERTRQELADTVDALAYKFDVKAQARRRLAATKSQLHAETARARIKSQVMVDRLKNASTNSEGKLKPGPPIGLVAVGGAVVLLAVWSRRR